MQFRLNNQNSDFLKFYFLEYDLLYINYFKALFNKTLSQRTNPIILFLYISTPEAFYRNSLRTKRYKQSEQIFGLRNIKQILEPD